MKKIINRTARVLAILFVGFIALFALDVFSDFSWMALFMNLLPTFIALAMTVTAWKRPLIGGILFVLVGAVYLVLARSRLLALPIVIPAVIIGALFIIGNFSSEKKPGPEVEKSIPEENLFPEPKEIVKPAITENSEELLAKIDKK
jgi:hypothetical protein